MFTRRDAGLHLVDDLLHHGRRLRLVLAAARGKLFLDPLRHHTRNNLTHRRRAKHFLGLPFKLWLSQADRDDRRQAGHDVVLFRLIFARFEAARVGFDRVAHGACEPVFEAGQVRTALRGRDDVDEGTHRGVVADAPAQGDVDVAGALDVLHGRVSLIVQDRD